MMKTAHVCYGQKQPKQSYENKQMGHNLIRLSDSYHKLIPLLTFSVLKKDIRLFLLARPEIAEFSFSWVQSHGKHYWRVHQRYAWSPQPRPIPPRRPTTAHSEYSRLQAWGSHQLPATQLSGADD